MFMNNSSSHQVASYKIYRDTERILEKLGTNENPIDTELKNTLSYLQNTESSQINNVTNYEITPYIIKSGDNYIQKYRVDNKVGDFSFSGDLREYIETVSGGITTKTSTVITKDFIDGYVLIDGQLYTHNCELLMIENIFSFNNVELDDKDKPTSLTIPFKKATGEITNLHVVLKVIDRNTSDIRDNCRLFNTETKEIITKDKLPNNLYIFWDFAFLVNCILSADNVYVLSYNGKVADRNAGDKVVWNWKVIYPLSEFTDSQ